jgi:site-specific recombinase XerD
MELERPFLVALDTMVQEKTRERYRRYVEDYKLYCESANLDPNDPVSTQKYFAECREDGYAASTIWTLQSGISFWFHSVHNIKLLEAVSMLGKMLKNWSKSDTVKRSAVFSEEEVNNFFSTDSRQRKAELKV